jgi:hypothetical protein
MSVSLFYASHTQGDTQFHSFFHQRSIFQCALNRKSFHYHLLPVSACLHSPQPPGPHPSPNTPQTPTTQIQPRIHLRPTPPKRSWKKRKARRRTEIKAQRGEHRLCTSSGRVDSRSRWYLAEAVTVKCQEVKGREEWWQIRLVEG